MTPSFDVDQQFDETLNWLMTFAEPSEKLTFLNEAIDRFGSEYRALTGHEYGVDPEVTLLASRLDLSNDAVEKRRSQGLVIDKLQIAMEQLQKEVAFWQEQYNELLDIVGKVDHVMATANPFDREILHHQEAAAFLGISPDHLYHLTSKRLIPYYKDKTHGHRNYFKRSDLVEFVTQNKVVTMDELRARVALEGVKRRNKVGTVYGTNNAR